MIVRLLFILAFLAVPVFGQAPAGKQDRVSPPQKRLKIPSAHSDHRWLIDTPTASMLPRGSFDIDFKTFPSGGVQAALNIGLARRFSVGIGYSGGAVLSEDIPEWNSRIEFMFRFLLADEREYEFFPSLAVGYSSYGYGLFVKEDTIRGYHEDRYLVKSPGFYLAMSKRYDVQGGDFGLHGGLNYSLENGADSDPNLFWGMDAVLGYDLVFLGEYDFALNDNRRLGIFGLGRGYLNFGLGWYITPELCLELDFRNMLLNRKQSPTEGSGSIDREIRLTYLQFFVD